jgi:hypothetical protein
MCFRSSSGSRSSLGIESIPTSSGPPAAMIARRRRFTRSRWAPAVREAHLTQSELRRAEAATWGSNLSVNPTRAGPARPRINFDHINRTALRSLPVILSRRLPRRKEGLEYVALEPRRNDRHLGSFRINLRTGRWAGDTGDSRRATAGGALRCALLKWPAL